MKHYTSEQWADFARDVVKGNDKVLMQQHLDGGCRNCAKELGLWQRVSVVARRQSTAEPSEGAVRYAKAMFAAGGHRAAATETVPLVGQLLFDSLRAPALAGVRSAVAQGPRQLLFGIGDHRIDLRLEPQFNSDKVAIIGQVLDSGNPDQVLSKIPVSLHRADKVVAASETNHYGEFQLECDLVGRLELRAMLPQGQEISVSLIEPAAPKAPELPYVDDSNKEQKALREGKNSTRKKA
ncbi:MAG TPA: hypothetical protein VNU84_07585 [Candidatus Acidoferrum sp.]|jgi:hypothetical protein|nr:hypothetical protein [Candidatus Acidoferrum sp.]